ncbi:LysR substrate-binding domain-containing protein [Radicibacter daui]|uniref:LysR substrate-binding domain-containing protein n=1 Tax=Radicibacter daui TaxID=3064829 RepID=UPI004046EA57
MFLAIARHLSFRQAAVELGVTPSALSHALRALEERLDVRLFNRTTRSVALTEAGERLYKRLRPAFLDIDDALDDLNRYRGSPSGLLRLNVPRSAARIGLLPMLGRFRTAYPEIELDIVVEDRLVDIVAGGFDAGIRFGEMLQQDMIALPFGPRQRFSVVATPDLIARVGRPLVPHDLQKLPCIRFRYASGTLYRWEFGRGGEAVEVEVNGPVTLSDMDMMPLAATQGAGFAFTFHSQTETLVAEGRLIRVLEDWCPFYPGFFFYYPSRRQLPAALRAFVDFVKQASG